MGSQKQRNWNRQAATLASWTTNKQLSARCEHLVRTAPAPVASMNPARTLEKLGTVAAAAARGLTAGAYEVVPFATATDGASVCACVSCNVSYETNT